ncbi:hypothetical protein E2C01_025372 [Portunus trituberculatus]|uniref:Uncharacterized protein n=1 Tax=Portunus trituberculatus TaxID=210409 RepID=A0A5B7EFL8_PORTR|nr:hypothetical protein [Portunus trituberculatus]
MRREAAAVCEGGKKMGSRYHDNGVVDDLKGSHTHHNNNNSGAFAWATRHLQLTCTVCACLLIPIALSYCISCPAAHASTPTALHYAPSCPSWASQHSTCPPYWRPQASTPLGNLQSFAFVALINNKNKLVFHIPT